MNPNATLLEINSNATLLGDIPPPISSPGGGGLRKGGI